MSISMERYGSGGGFARYDPHAAPAAAPVQWRVECFRCGFEPADALAPPRVCPKCGSGSFEWSPVPGGLLLAATGTRPGMHGSTGADDDA